MRENRLSWFGNVKRKIDNASVRSIESIIMEGKISQGRLMDWTCEEKDT